MWQVHLITAKRRQPCCNDNVTTGMSAGAADNGIRTVAEQRQAVVFLECRITTQPDLRTSTVGPTRAVRGVDTILAGAYVPAMNMLPFTNWTAAARIP